MSELEERLQGLMEEFLSTRPDGRFSFDRDGADLMRFAAERGGPPDIVVEDAEKLLVDGRGAKPKPKTNIQVVREVVVPWVLEMEPGTEFNVEDATDVLRRAGKYNYWGIHDAIRPVLEFLIKEDFLEKNRQGRAVSYTRIKYE